MRTYDNCGLGVFVCSKKPIFRQGCSRGAKSRTGTMEQKIFATKFSTNATFLKTDIMLAHARAVTLRGNEIMPIFRSRRRKKKKIVCNYGEGDFDEDETVDCLLDIQQSHRCSLCSKQYQATTEK